MQNLSLQAREILLNLFQWGYDSHQIKNALEDGECLKNAGISEELAEEMHNFIIKGNY